MVCVITLFIVNTIVIRSYTIKNKPNLNITKRQTLRKKPSRFYAINQKGCRIPYLNLYDQSIKEYIFKPPPINCTKEKPDIITQTYNTILVDARSYSSVQCCYRYFWRRSRNEYRGDQQFFKSLLCVQIENNEVTTISHEFVIVFCIIDFIKYRYFYSFIQKKKITDKLKLNDRTNGDYLSVLVVGIDSMSRLNFQRQMSKTYDFLKTKLNVQEMLGYNKIDDNSFPNLMVFLNGLRRDEYKKMCLTNNKTKEPDYCPLIWKQFDESGFITAYGEDSTDLGQFSFYRKVLLESPTDFDYRIFDEHVATVVGNTLSPLFSHLCLGNDLRISKLLQYIKMYATTFKKHRYFGFFWGLSMSHNYLNNPYLTDEMYYQLFKDLYESGALTNTALLVLSDQGYRYGDIRSTYQGFFEERLPMLFIYTPQWFRDKYSLAWANIIMNTRRLTTPLDIYETLLDLKNLNFLRTEKLIRRLELSKTKNMTISRGLSLFLPSPQERTCKVATISNYYCACQSLRPLNVSLNAFDSIGQFVVNKINKLLRYFKSCAKLKLEQIIDVSQSIINSRKKIKLKRYISDLLIKITATPGQGNFEALVRVNNGAPKLISKINRINFVENQSYCISNVHLKLYCFCE